MSNRAGSRPLRHGLRLIGEILLLPRVLAIYLFVVLIAIAPITIWTIYAEANGTPINHAVLSFFLGALVTLVLLTFFALIAVLAGGVNWITGALAERTTSNLLKKLGPDWQTFHNIVIPPQRHNGGWQADIDHVAVGPYGVLVIDTKYTSLPFEFDSPQGFKYLRYDLDQVKRNALRVRELLNDESLAPGIVPVLIYWGVRIVESDTPITRIDGVRVVSGYDFKRWKPLLSDRRMTLEDQHFVTETLQRATSQPT